MSDSLTNSGTLDARSVSAPLFDGKIWLKILGIAFIVQGVSFVLTIFGIIVAWIPLWLGVKCMKAAKTLERAYTGNDMDGLVETNRHLKTVITIMGVLQLLMAVMYIAAIIIGFTMPLALGVMGQ